jgi:hypothetical protein
MKIGIDCGATSSIIDVKKANECNFIINKCDTKIKTADNRIIEDLG